MMYNVYNAIGFWSILLKLVIVMLKILKCYFKNNLSSFWLIIILFGNSGKILNLCVC